MGESKRKSTGDGIIDLSNDADWKARLEEARARRAEVLKEANSSRPPRKSTKRRLSEQEKVLPPLFREGEDREEIDFHDRMNRLKRLSRIEEPRERTPEEIALINEKFFGRKPAEGQSSKPEETNLPHAKAAEVEELIKEIASVNGGAAVERGESVKGEKKPIERAQTRIILFEDTVNGAEADATSDHLLEPDLNSPADAYAAEATAEAEGVPSRVRMAVGLATIGAMLLLASATLIPVTI